MPTFSNLTNGSSTTSFVTASVSPAVNRLILVTVHGYIATGSTQPSTPTVTGNGITYTLVDSTPVDNSGTDQSAMWVFRGKLPGTSAGAITFSFSGVVPTRCSWSVDQGSTDIDVSGANAASAIVAGTNNKAVAGATVTTLSVSFVGSMTSGNGAFFACGIENNNSQTPEGTWTALANVIGTSLIGTSTQYLTTGTDTATATTWTTAARAGAILLEILAAAVVPPGDTSESKIYFPGFLNGSNAGESGAGDWPQFLLAVGAPFRTLLPVPGSPTPSLPGSIPYVEPEAHAHNPVIKDGNDNLYRLTESDITGGPAPGNHPLMYKSTDGGITWTDMDSLHNPTAQDLECTWVMQVGTQIIVGVNRDDQVWRVPFNTSDTAAGAGTVAFDVSATQVGSSVSTINWLHTCTGTNRVLLVDVAVGNNPDSRTVSVTYGGVLMTSLLKRHSEDGTTGFLERFALAAPSSGSNSIVVTLAGGTATSIVGGSMSFAYADQALGNYVTTSAVSPGGGSTAMSVTAIAPPTGSMVMGGHGAGNSITSVSATSRYNQSNSAATACGNLGGNTAPGAGSNITSTGTVSAIDSWVSFATVIPSGTADSWGTQETVDSGLSSTGVEQFVSFTRPSNGQEWWFYSDTLATTNQQMAYRHRTAVNTYSAKVDLGGNTAVSYTGPSAVLGASDLSYVFYTDVTNAQLFYRTLTTGGTLSGATRIDSAGTSDFSGSPSRYAHTNGVYYNDAGTEVVAVIYADTSEMLKLVRIVGGTPQAPEAVSTSSVLCNPSATTSDAIIAHLAMDGTTILAIWSDAATGDLYLRRRAAGGTWDAVETLWTSGGNLAYYVYNLVFTRAGRRVMGYVYDVGDHTNDVSNLRYNELDLGAASGSNQFNQALNATLSFTSSQVRAIRTNLAGALSFTGSLTKRTAKNLGTATLSFTGSVATQAVHVFTQALNATLSFTSSQSRAVRTNLAGALSFTSSQTRRVGKGVSAVLSFTGSLPRRTSTNLAGVLSFTSSQTRRTAKNLGTAALSFTGNLTNQAVHHYTQALNATLSFSGSVSTAAVHFFTQALTASLSFTSSQTRSIGTHLAGALSFTGSITKRTAKSLTVATLSFTSSQTRSTRTNLAGALSFTGSVTKRTAKNLGTATLSFTGSVTTAAVHFFTQALSASLSFTGSLSTRRIVSKVLSASLSFTSSQTKRTATVLAAGLSFTGSQTKRIAKTISAALGLTGLLDRLSSAQPRSGTASAADGAVPTALRGSGTAPTSEAGDATGPTSSAP